MVEVSTFANLDGNKFDIKQNFRFKYCLVHEIFFFPFKWIHLTKLRGFFG